MEQVVQVVQVEQVDHVAQRIQVDRAPHPAHSVSARRGAASRVARAATSPRARGQSLVEFALILPVFIVIIMGVVEYSLINASIGAFNFAAQDAARYSAIIGPTNPGVAAPYDQTDLDMFSQVIVPRTSGLVMANIVTVEVFKANEGGSCFIPGSGPGAFPCGGDNNIYTASTNSWSVAWPDNARGDQLVSADYLGVRIAYEYTYLTAFFATTSPQLNLTAISVQRIEPQEYAKAPAPRGVVTVFAGPGGVNPGGGAVLRPVSWF